MDGNIQDLPNTVQTKLVLEIREKYNAIVLRPEVLQLQMQAVLDRTIAGVQREILQICGKNDDVLRAFVRNDSHQIERFQADDGWVSVSSGENGVINVASICSATDLMSGGKLVDELMAEKPMGDLDAGVNDVIIRLSRPFATKLISFMVLPLAATAIAGGIALPFVGIAGGVLTGVLAGGAVSAMIIGFSASAAVDWLLTRADEAFSREEFETYLRRAVNVAASRFEERAAAALKLYVTDQYGQVTATLFGHKPEN